MANTFDADLILDTIANRVKTTLGHVLAPLNAFSSDFSDDVLRQGKNHQISVVTGGSTTLTNPTDFEQGDSTETNVPVPVSHYSQPFHLTSAELNKGKKLEALADKNLETLAESIMGVAVAPMTPTNFTATPIDVAQASIAVANLQTAWAAIARSKVRNILLDGVAFSKFLPTSKDSFVPGSGAYGFNQFHLNTRWTGAGTNVYGFAGGPDAVCVAAALPEIHPSVRKLLDGSRVVYIESLGLYVQINMWGSTKSRTAWASFDVMFGAAFGGDANAGVLIRSAAP